MNLKSFIFACAYACTSFVQAHSLIKYPQVPMQPQGADVGIVFIGGFMDEVTGIMQHVYAQCPKLGDALQEQRAYYHWHGDHLDQPWPHLQACLQDVAAFQHRNPTVPLVLVGHSMGAVAAFELANRLDKGSNRIYLITLDPVDKHSARKLSLQVDWWGHAYIENSPSKRDFIFDQAGRWGSMPEADANWSYEGEEFIHDWAGSMLLKRAGRAQSLWENLRENLDIF